MKDFFSKTLHPLHIFEEDEVLYAADLEKARIVELSVVMVEMLKFAETQNDQEIQRTLRNSYPDDNILEAFERFAALQRQGLIFLKSFDKAGLGGKYSEITAFGIQMSYI